MIKNNKKPDFTTNEDGLNTNSLGQSDGCKNTKSFSISVNLFWEAKLDFVQNGGNLLPNEPLLQSKFLREMSNLLLIDGLVYYSSVNKRSEYYANYVTHQTLINGFHSLRREYDYFFKIVSSNPEYLQIFKEFYE